MLFKNLKNGFLLQRVGSSKVIPWAKVEWED